MAPMALLPAHLIFCWLLAAVACVPVPGGTSTAPPWLPQHPFLGMALQFPQTLPALNSFSPLQGLSLLWSTYGPWLSFRSCLAVGRRDFCLYPSHLQQTVPVGNGEPKGQPVMLFCLVWFWLGALPSCHSQDVGAWRDSSPYRVGLGDTCPCPAQVSHRDTQSQVL